MSSSILEGWGWGEVVTDGLGVAYNVLNDGIQVNVTCCQGKHPSISCCCACAGAGVGHSVGIGVDGRGDELWLVKRSFW
jgi:hypothetical protein